MFLQDQFAPYRREMSRRRNASRSPRFSSGVGGGRAEFGPSLASNQAKAISGLISWAGEQSTQPLQQGLSAGINRLF